MIGDNIQARRAAVGKTQEQLAEEVGVSRQTVAKWESGETSPDFDHAIRVASVVDVSLDDLASFDSKAAGIPVPPRGKHLFGTVTLGERGQLVIPKAAREVFDLHAGDVLVVLGDEEQGIAITKAETFMAGVNDLVSRMNPSA